MFNDYVNLRPWKKAADLLAQEIWEPLYDLGQLARNQVKVSAVTGVSHLFFFFLESCARFELSFFRYFDDMFVSVFFFSKKRKVVLNGTCFPRLWLFGC